MATYNEPGRGRKQCPQCEKYCGVKTAVCENCGNVFTRSPNSETPARPSFVAAASSAKLRIEDLEVLFRAFRKHGLTLESVSDTLTSAYLDDEQNDQIRRAWLDVRRELKVPPPKRNSSFFKEEYAKAEE